jgi:NADPH2:quinone reductase
MRAMVLPRFGPPELFELRDIDVQRPGPGQVLVRVRASGTNPVDSKLRANGAWAGLEPPVVLGYDVAGVIEEVGDGVSDFDSGDEVYYTPEILGNPHGSYAEYNTVSASIVARKPANLSFVEAAAVPLAGGTAWEAVVRRLRIRVGETVLIHAGAGGVGSFAVQFAKASGARVLATASADNLETLRDLGADVAIDYREADAVEVALAETGGRGVDAAFDIEGENLISRCLKGIRPMGRAACILPPQGDLTLLYQRNITLFGVFLTRERTRLEEMRPVFEEGQAVPLIDQALPLEKVSKAHERLDSRHGRGKLILEVSP